MKKWYKRDIRDNIYIECDESYITKEFERKEFRSQWTNDDHDKLEQRVKDLEEIVEKLVEKLGQK